MVGFGGAMAIAARLNTHITYSKYITYLYTAYEIQTYDLAVHMPFVIVHGSLFYPTILNSMDLFLRYPGNNMAARNIHHL